MKQIIGKLGNEKRVWRRIVGVCLVVILIASIMAALIQTDFGKVRIIEVQLPTTNQQFSNGYLFVPQEASAENPLPVVITMHGSLNSKEMQDAASIELSRRGVIVLAIDGYEHGLSSLGQVSEGKDSESAGGSASQGSRGMIPWVEFLYNNLDYVDRDKIGVMGHSMGGRAAWSTVNYYGKLYDAAIEEAMQPDSDGGTEITEAEQAYADSQVKVFAAAIEGVANRSEGYFDLVRNVNFAMLYGGLEESGYRNRSGTPLFSEDSIEILELVNSGRPADDQLTSVEIGTIYGDPNQRNARAIYNRANIFHGNQWYSTTFNQDMISWWTAVYELDTDLGPTNQVWNVKAAFNTIALVALFVLIVPAIKLLLSMEFFADLKKPVSEPTVSYADGKVKKLFWTGMAAGTIVSLIATLLANQWYTYLSPNGDTSGYTYWWGEYCTNYMLLWALLCTLWTVIWLFIVYRVIGKKSGATLENMGIKVSWRYIGKALFLSLIMVGLVYSMVAFFRWSLRTDFRFWAMGFKTFTPKKIQNLIEYVPFFFIYYVASGILFNWAMRLKDMKQSTGEILCVVSQVLGPIIICIIQYAVLFARFEPAWGEQWIPLLNMVQNVPVYAIAALYSRRLYKETGTIWVGAIFCAIFFTMFGVCNTQDYTLPVFRNLFYY